MKEMDFMKFTIDLAEKLNIDLTKKVDIPRDPLMFELDEVIARGNREVPFSEMSPELVKRLQISGDRYVPIWIPEIGYKSMDVREDRVIFSWL